MKKYFSIIIFTILSVFTFVGCQSKESIEQIPVSVTVDGETIEVAAQIGSSVQTILANSDITISQLDKVTPPLFTLVTQKADITITRITEEFETQELVIPFEQQTVRNESLPDQQTILIQPGVNGQQEITYRLVYEDGQLISKSEVNRVNIVYANPEIIMVGVQNPFSPIEIPGKIVYIASGNAWLMDGDTSNRRPIVTNNLLDGRVFEISPDGEWLLFSQLSEDPEIINELYIINIDETDSEPIYIKADNVIHYAEWVPGFNLQIAYSTVEPRSVAPGWQANNDLQITTLGSGGRYIKTDEIIEANSGGIYGWWGTTYHFSPGGYQIAFARPDAIGIVDQEENELIPLVNLVPYQTRSEWAWISPLAWSPDGEFLYFVEHNPSGNAANQEASMVFDLKSIYLEDNSILTGFSDVGMFSYPKPSNYLENEQFKFVYLSAIFPDNSDISRYRLNIADRDGSNSQFIFPDPDAPGMDPQLIEWSPCNIENNRPCYLGFTYQGNIWLIDHTNYSSKQITGDGLITKIDWK